MVSTLQPSKHFIYLGGGHFEKLVKIMFLMPGFLGAFWGGYWDHKELKLLESVCLHLSLGSPYKLFMGYFDQINVYVCVCL